MIQCKSFTKKLFIVPMLFIALFSIFSNARGMYAEHQDIFGDMSSKIALIKFSGEELIALFRNGTMKSWLREDKQWVENRTITLENKDNFKLLALSSDGTMIAAVSSSDDRIIKILNVQNEQLAETQALTGHSSPISSIAFSPDGTMFAATSGSGVILWRLQNEEWTKVKTIEPEYLEYYYKIAFSPNNTSFATALHETIAGKSYEIIEIWPVQENEQRTNIQKIFLDNTIKTDSVTFSPDGKTLVVRSHNKMTRIWMLQDSEWKEVEVIRHDTMPSSQVVFSPDGTTLAIPSEGIITLLSFQKYECCEEYNNEKKCTGWKKCQILDDSFNYSTSIAFSRDGSTLAASHGSDIKIWHKEPKTILDPLHSVLQTTEKELILSMLIDPLHEVMKQYNNSNTDHKI